MSNIYNFGINIYIYETHIRIINRSFFNSPVYKPSKEKDRLVQIEKKRKKNIGIVLKHESKKSIWEVLII